MNENDARGHADEAPPAVVDPAWLHPASEARRLQPGESVLVFLGVKRPPPHDADHAQADDHRRPHHDGHEHDDEADSA